MSGPDPILDLVRLLARLPGVGERTATRLAYHLLAKDAEYAAALGEAIAKIHERVRRCEQCGNFCAGPLCRVCEDPRREPHVLCVVARVPDLDAIEKSHSFTGRYYVLHRLLAPLDGIGPDDLPLEDLIERVRKGVTEVIIATPLSVEGEATALYVAQVLRPLGVRISRIASGIPHGGELEFADQVTVGRAFQGRRDL